MLIDWDPYAAIAAGVGPDEARRFLAADDFDFMAWNHGPDSGGTWADAEAEVRRTHPHWAEHALAYRPTSPPRCSARCPAPSTWSASCTPPAYRCGA